MKRIFVLLTLMLGISFGSLGAKANECDVYAFGDSLSDIGADSLYSAFAQSNGLEPPSDPPVAVPAIGTPIVPPEGFYSDGRYSDDKIWVEYLKYTKCPEGSLSSFARGGAFSDDRNSNLDIGVSGGLLTQVFEDLDDVLLGGDFAADDIITVWAFSNNIVFDLLMVNPVQAVEDVTVAVQELASRGAMTILVLNAPAIGDTPFGQFLAQQAFPGLPNNLNARARQYNNMLRVALTRLNQTLDANVVHLDINALFHAILTDPASHGFVNVTAPCMIQLETRERILTPLPDNSGAVCPALDGGAELVLYTAGTAFYDLLHVTSAAHLLIAMSAVDAL
jgi:hypothetical protein